MATKSRTAQTLANAFPTWSRTRTDEQSLGFQFLNAIGSKTDDLNKQISIVGDNYFVMSSKLAAIDVYYTVPLPGTFEFELANDDVTQVSFIPPIVSGLYDGTWFSVSIAEKNDIETFWNTAVPDRITLDDTVDGSHLLASGYSNLSPFSPLTASGFGHITNQLTITVSGVVSCIGINNNLVVRRAMVQVDGVNRQGRSVVEEVPFLHNDVIRTRNEFAYLNDPGVKVYGMSPADTAHIRVTSADFQSVDVPLNYDIDQNPYREDMDLFFSLGITPSGQHVLNLVKYDTDDLELRLDGFSDKHTLFQQELLDASGMQVGMTDLAIEPHSDRFWTVSDNWLHVYDAALPHVDTTGLKDKNYAAASTIEPSTYYAVQYEEIDLDYIWQRPVTGIVRHRVWVEWPDGTKKTILPNGVISTYSIGADSWTYEEPATRKIRPTETHIMDQIGQYVYSLEVDYTDGTSSIDQRIVLVLTKTALASFELTPVGVLQASGVDFDSENNLWILGMSGLKYKIGLHHDVMLVDTRRKALYVREPYTQVRVF